MTETDTPAASAATSAAAPKSVSPAAASPPGPAPAPERRSGGGLLRSLGTEEWILVGLTVLSVVGIAISDFSSQSGLRYWLALVPVFAAASIFAGWSRARRSEESVAGILWRQGLHWAALALAVYVIYLLAEGGRLSREDAGVVALLSLALTTVLAGVHFDWRLGLLGLLLGIAGASAALVEEFFWILLIPALVIGGILVFTRKPAG